MDCKPNSVPAWAGHDHLTGMPVTRHLVQPTRRLQAGRPQTSPYLVLHPVGFTLPFVSPRRRWALTSPFQPCLWMHTFHRRCIFCGTFPRFPGVRVTNHRALRCSDFPLRRLSERSCVHP